MIFVEHGLIVSQIDYKILTGIVLILLDLLFREKKHVFSGIKMNWCEEIKLVEPCN